MSYSYSASGREPQQSFRLGAHGAMSSNFYIGQRLSFSGALCTVRYVGPVQGTKGDWLGVEWDDPVKGKHSGEHEGVKYFECQFSHGQVRYGSLDASVRS